MQGKNRNVKKNLARASEKTMYIKNQNSQLKFSDFQQPIGLKMNPKNRWIKKAESIPWAEIENRYSKLFPSMKGNPAKPLRMALGSLLIQKQYGYSDRELVEQITENPYYQYFVGLPGYQMEAPFVPSLLVEFRKRLTEEILMEINEMIINYNKTDDNDGDDNQGGEKEQIEPNDNSNEKNSGTLMLDATCAPQHIAFPQDINLLNAAREDLEEIIDTICKDNNEKKPRTYREKARKDYLDLAKSKKRSKTKIRKAIKKQLNYVKRDLGYIDTFLEKGIVLSQKDSNRLVVIRKVYEQQKTMYDEKKNSIPNRIVSLDQPYIRPIVRGKAKTPTEFGAKIDMSIDENGMARLEKMSFEAYNESDVLIGAIQRYFDRWNHYPERVLVDKIYRNRKNLAFCKEYGIRLSGPALGRPKKDSVSDIKTEYKDAVDRIEVERGFSLAKRNFGLGCIWTKLDVTTKSSIALSIVAMNLHRLTVFSFLLFIKRLFFQIVEQFSDRKAFRISIAQTNLC